MVCKKCGINNVPGNNYCYICGAKLNRKSKAGILVAVVLGAIILLGVQIAAATLVFNKFMTTDDVDTKSSNVPQQKPVNRNLEDKFYDDYDWLGED